MRHLQSLGRDSLLAEEQYVEVQRARCVSLARCAFLVALLLAVATCFALDGKQSVECLFPVERGFDHPCAIQKRFGGMKTPWFGAICCRMSHNRSDTFRDESLCCIHPSRYIAYVASTEDYHPSHRYKCFICLLTANAKCVKTMRGFPFCPIWRIANSIWSIIGSIFSLPINGANLLQKAASSPHR